jgi:hypothetical protein
VADHDLPPNLAAFEQELIARDRPEPDAALRERVLRAVRQELGRRPWRLSGNLAASLAAAVLLLANFLMSLGNYTTWTFQPDFDNGRIEATAVRIRAASPDIPEGEAYRQALLVHAAAWRFAAPPRPLIFDPPRPTEEMEPWDTH